MRRGVEAAAQLDWPRDKLHIQLLDDSTDETAEIARTVAAELRGQGFRHRGAAAHRPLGLQGRRAARGDAADAARLLRDLRRRLRAAGRFPAPLHARRSSPSRRRRFRAGALRLPQSARERADRDADGDARRPSRHRAGDALVGRPSAALQRHLRHLAARRDRGGRRLEGRHGHRGPRPHLSRLGQGLARRCSSPASPCRASCRPTPRPGCASSSAGRTASAMSRCACSR